MLRDGRRVRLLQVDTPEFRSGECYLTPAAQYCTRIGKRKVHHSLRR